MNLLAHRTILPHAVAMALLIELPLIIFPVFAAEKYRGINIAHFGTDQHFYLSRARDVVDGHGLGNSILSEGKDGRDSFFTWNERVLLAPYRWLGVADSVNVATLYTVMNAVGVFLLVILIYALAYQLSGNALLSTLIATFVIGGSSFVFYRTFFYEDMNLYGRAMTPYVSSLGLFIYLNLLVRCMVRPRARTLLATATALGSLFYIYLFAWSYALTLHALLLGLYVLRRDWIRVKALAITLMGGVALGAYNLAALFSALFSETSRQLTYFHYVEHTRMPMFSTVGAALLILFFVYWLKNRKDERLPILLGVILAGWVVVNQQILTGIRIQPGHFYWYFIVPLGIVVGLFMFWTLLRHSWRAAFCIACICAVYVNTLVGQYRSALKSLPAKIDEQRFQPLIEALQADAERSVVLTAHDDRAFVFTIYTRHDLFWHNAATYYELDERHLKDAVTLFLFLDRRARENVSAFLRAAIAESPSGPVTLMYHTLEGYASGLTYPEYNKKVADPDAALLAHRDALVAELTREVERLTTEPNAIRDMLARYGVEYVVWDESANPDWDVSVLREKREIVANDRLHLYRLDAS